MTAMTATAVWDWTDIPVSHPRDFAYLFGHHLDDGEIEAAYRLERRHLESCPWQEVREQALAHLEEARIDAEAYAFSRILSRKYPRVSPPAAAAVTMPRPGAAPPREKWMALVENEPRTMAAADRKLGKPSASEHDMVLANICAEAGFTDQEIADTLWSNRRRRREDLKHLTYYRITATKALQRSEKA